MMADDGRRSDATVPKPINNNYLKTLGLAGSDVTAMQVEIIMTFSQVTPGRLGMQCRAAGSQHKA